MLKVKSNEKYASYLELWSLEFFFVIIINM